MAGISSNTLTKSCFQRINAHRKIGNGLRYVERFTPVAEHGIFGRTCGRYVVCVPSYTPCHLVTRTSLDGPSRAATVTHVGACECSYIEIWIFQETCHVDGVGICFHCHRICFQCERSVSGTAKVLVEFCSDFIFQIHGQGIIVDDRCSCCRNGGIVSRNAHVLCRSNSHCETVVQGGDDIFAHVRALGGIEV